MSVIGKMLHEDRDVLEVTEDELRTMGVHVYGEVSTTSK